MRSKDDHLKFLSDLAKVMTGAMGSFTDVRRQIHDMVRDGMDQVMGQMDMVTRADFERVEALAEKARERQLELEARLAVLEKKAGIKTAPAKAAKKKTAVKKKGKKK